MHVLVTFRYCFPVTSSVIVHNNRINPLVSVEFKNTFKIYKYQSYGRGIDAIEKINSC